MLKLTDPRKSATVPNYFGPWVSGTVSPEEPHLGHGVGGRAFVQKQERHLLIIVMCCHMERGEAILYGVDGERTWITQRLVYQKFIKTNDTHRKC